MVLSRYYTRENPYTRENLGTSSGFATQNNVGLVAALEIGPDGSLYVLDNYLACPKFYYCNHSRIRKIDPQGQISLIAGSPEGFNSIYGKQYNLDLTAKATDAVFKTDDIKMDQTGNLYFIENQTNKLFKITPEGMVEEVARDFIEKIVKKASDESGSTILKLTAGGPDNELSVAAMSVNKSGDDKFYQYRIGKSRLGNDQVISDSEGKLLYEFDQDTQPAQSNKRGVNRQSYAKLQL